MCDSFELNIFKLSEVLKWDINDTYNHNTHLGHEIQYDKSSRWKETHQANQ